MASRRQYRSAARRRQQHEGAGAVVVLSLFLAWFLSSHVWVIGLLVFLIILLAGLVIILKRRKRRQLDMAGITQIDRMSGRQFEERLAAFFQQWRYHVELTPVQGDYGADLILVRDGIRTAVQAKRYKGAVGVAAVQEIVSARGFYRCQHAIVVTNSYFTPAAQRLAAANGVTLWDRARLVSELAAVTAVDRPVQDQQLQW